MRHECSRHGWRIRLAASAVLVLAFPGPPAGAQQAPSRAIELRPFIGTLQPLDDRTQLFLGGSYSGVQLAAEFASRLHLVSSVAWTYTSNQFLANGGTDLWHADLGVETGPRRSLDERWEVHPLVGAGGGARVYDYRNAGTPRSASPTGYVSGALELQSERVGIRGDARLLASRFESPATGARRTRYDVALSIGIAYHLAGRRRP